MHHETVDVGGRSTGWQRLALVSMLALAGVAPLAEGCEGAPSGRPVDTVLIDLGVDRLEPGTWLPGTAITIVGSAFVDDPWGMSSLRLAGAVRLADGSSLDVDLTVPARFVDASHMVATIDDTTFEALGGGGARFDGSANVEVLSAVDGKLYRSRSLPLGVALERHLAPELALARTDGVVFPNEPLELAGSGLLLGDEGQSLARIEGCFTPKGAGECSPIAATEVPLQVPAAPARDRATLPFVPGIAGIEPGRFEGTVVLVNRHRDGTELEAPAVSCTYDLEAPILYGVTTDGASLGQYVDISGAGFLGGGEGDTLLHFVGTFTPDATLQPTELDEFLLPEWRDGRAIRYVISEDDAIGRRLDVRVDTGVFEGTITPITAYGDSEVTGDATPLRFRLEPVRQVVYVNFLPAYTESLRHFGLRALDREIRDRVVAVIQRDYATINLDVRTEVPEDFALYTQVDIGGPDPNGLGLLGYDNTPGKDVDNRRLYDRIGGVNATTQRDGYPGYGGVFIESLFGYSEQPGDFAMPLSVEPSFDELFDPFRPDRDGDPVLGSDLGEPLPPLASGERCPVDDGDRRLQIACAVWALGSMIGTTVSHEIGHSLGLADPYGALFHNTGDAPDRLMDADRPFAERAELAGEGPSRFCVNEYEYLRGILPTSDSPDPEPRPPCY